jgi:hypothetical protein
MARIAEAEAWVQEMSIPPVLPVVLRSKSTVELTIRVRARAGAHADFVSEVHNGHVPVPVGRDRAAAAVARGRGLGPGQGGRDLVRPVGAQGRVGDGPGDPLALAAGSPAGPDAAASAPRCVPAWPAPEDSPLKHGLAPASRWQRPSPVRACGGLPGPCRNSAAANPRLHSRFAPGGNHTPIERPLWIDNRCVTVA